ncbi:DUF2911 domain-containing protein [Neolewinella aurantiaca]|uniref:DUF2911 domain-containing protein n=1 Tax=Neolewinella aurantiaca TaxID=2602767 RepID=A0A5C7FJ03_9BACT|nr:DUF2911 domain-containing protein [Neolewinella aurantiaca]TXF89793.1 DUF2911 domain-containing protein [Neolewinella aurantiaca]
MLKNVMLFAAALMIFASCANTDTSQDTVDTSEPDTTALSAVPTDGGQSMDETKDGYKLNIVDGTIKSPRKELVGKIGEVPVVINYGSPAVNDRVIYGDLVPYNKVWRTGANEATRITFQRDVMVGKSNTKLTAGTYALFSLPSSKDDWTIIFNKVADQWGAYDYEESSDAARVKAESMPAPERAERMDFALDGNDIQMMWDDLVVAFPVTTASK